MSSDVAAKYATACRRSPESTLFGISADACNLSFPGFSNSCAQSGSCFNAAFADSVWIFFARKFSRPCKE